MNETGCQCPAMDNGTNCSLSVYERYQYSFIEMMKAHDPLALAVDRTVTPMWYIIGFFGNAMSCRIWMDKRMKKNNSSAYYLAALAISDLVFLLLHIVSELKHAWGIPTLDYIVICELFFILYYMAQYLSPFLVLAFTTERFIAVCYPFQASSCCTRTTAKRLILALFLLALGISSMQGYIWHYDDLSGTCIHRLDAHEGGDTSLSAMWTWITEMIIFAVVPVTILILNMCVIRAVWRVNVASPSMENSTGTSLVNALQDAQAQRANNKVASTAMLLAVSFFVIAMTLPATVVNALESIYFNVNFCLSDFEIKQDEAWQNYFTYVTVRKFVEEICLSHYACNFFIFCITGSKFRKRFVRLVKNIKPCLMSTRYGKMSAEASIRSNHSATQNTKL